MRFPSLLLTLAVLAPTAASAGPLKGVTACDLRRLAMFYGTEAKARQIVRASARGTKILETERGPMREGAYYEVESARKVPAKCTFGEAGYTYADSVLLAQIWGTDPTTARTMVEDKIGWGDEYSVIWALQDARAGKIYEPQSADDAAMYAFLTGEVYTACDARLLAQTWQTDLESAKVAIGAKILARQEPALEGTLGPARQGAVARGETCEFWETGYSYDDAVRLAELWRTDVWSAKVRAGNMVMRGQNGVLRTMLRDGG